MRKYFCILVLFNSAFFQKVIAQQLPHFNLFVDHPEQVNPSVLPLDLIFDTNSYWRFSIHNRLQWQNLELNRAPLSGIIDGYYYSRGHSKMDWINGAQLIFDRNGRFSQVAMMASTSAQFILSDNKFWGPRLSLGITGGLVHYSLDLKDVVLTDFEFVGPSTSVVKPDFGFGVFYIHPKPFRRWLKGDKFFLGFSVPQLLNYSTKFLLNSNIQSDIVRIRHYYFHSGISIKFKEIQFEPSFWIKYVENSPIYIDGVIRFVFNETMRLGVGYGNNNLFHTSLGLRLVSLKKGYDSGHEGIYFNYSFGVQGGALKNFGNSHEFGLIYHR